MASSRKWDVNKYKTEFESEEQWQLRKKFMETHMDKFSEDRLVCLARVFFNVEFLGCRYPEKTMSMIAELSKGVADEHREKQKGKLKRTFVQASDAAGAKIKGSSTQVVEPPMKIAKTDEESSDYCSDHIKFSKPLQYPPDSEKFPGFVIFENCNAKGEPDVCPINILNQSVQKSKYNMNLVTTGRKCELYLNGKLLVSVEAPTPKEAKLNAAIEGLKRLRQTCYTIQVKRAYFSSGPFITKNSDVNVPEDRLPEDNIGSKMMQRMGWSGSGLGKKQQGIEDPIKAGPHIMNRAGFGCVNEKDLENKFTKLFNDYVKSESENDLVFSPDFTPEERKILHRAAQKLKLKTRSYGKGNDRRLVVYKQPILKELVEMLMECGGENEKYILIPPSGENDDSWENDKYVFILPTVKNDGDDSMENEEYKSIPPSGEFDSYDSAKSPLAQSEEEFCKDVVMPTQFIQANQYNLQFTSISNREEMSNQTNEEPIENEGGPPIIKANLHSDTYGNADISLVNEILLDKDRYLQNLVNRFINAVDIVVSKPKKNLDKRTKKTYKNTRADLQKYTGRYILNRLTPHDDKRPNIYIIKHKDRCHALGMAIARNSHEIKKLMCERIRKRFNISETDFHNSEVKKKHEIKDLICKEFSNFGDELIQMLLNNDSQYKSKHIPLDLYNDLVASNFNSIKNKPQLNGIILSSNSLETVPNYFISFFESLCQGNTTAPKNTLEKTAEPWSSMRNKTPKQSDIKFVKEHAVDEADSEKSEESGVENSGEEGPADDAVTGLQKPIDLRQSYINFLKSISYQEQPNSSLKQNLQKTQEDNCSTTGNFHYSISEDLSNCPEVIGESETLASDQMRIHKDNDDISDFFSKVTQIAKLLPPNIFPKLKYNIKNELTKTLQAEGLCINLQGLL